MNPVFTWERERSCAHASHTHACVGGLCTGGVNGSRVIWCWGPWRRKGGREGARWGVVIVAL